LVGCLIAFIPLWRIRDFVASGLRRTRGFVASGLRRIRNLGISYFWGLITAIFVTAVFRLRILRGSLELFLLRWSRLIALVGSTAIPTTRWCTGPSIGTATPPCYVFYRMLLTSALPTEPKDTGLST
jgi:hypothetical protein